jgi:hypothetical protein
LTSEDYYFLDRNEFVELENKEKWNYIQSLMRLIKDYKIQAERNCLECENNLLTTHDLNIDMYFEDWRECADHCEECAKDDRVGMCDIQFNIVNHLANSLGNLEDKLNALAKIILYKNKDGQELIKKWEDEMNKASNKSKDTQSMFQ